MRLNTLRPAPGSKRPRLRVGRGASAGQGKTSGRGVKGQRARKGGYHKVGFEGGQMPLQRRMPKVGFRSKIKASRAEVRLSDLERIEATEDDLLTLKQAGVVSVEMESDTLFVVGAYRGWRTGAIYTSDGTPTEIKPAWGHERYKKGQEDAIRIALKGMRLLARADGL